MSFHSFVNTAQFSYTARDFKKNGMRYTTAPRGSRDYFQFWEEEQRRCLYGYKVGDLWIPGRMYGYLNFFPISRVPEHLLFVAIKDREEKGKLSMNAIEKTVGFPGFWEVAYEWWNFKHIAWYGGSFMGINSPGNKHTCAVKSRGAGFSYMEAWDGVYNYTFIPGSKSYYFAGAEPFLIGDAIMDKVQSGLDWINQYCPYWKQNRQVHKNVMHQKASYMDSGGNERGTMSEIIAQIVDKAGKTRGKRGRKATFEEGGTFPVLEPALQVAMGSMKEGSVYVGQISVFGTGGEKGPSIQGLENVFNNPEVWDMLAFPNIWDEGFQNTTCGYFVPSWRVNTWYFDHEYNVDMASAMAADQAMRDVKKLSTNPKDLDRFKAEYPWTPSEALQRLTGNGFNVHEIDAQIKRLQSRRDLAGMVRYGDLISGTENGVEFTPIPKHIAQPIEDYPHSQAEGSNLNGCFCMVQEPYRDSKGHVPPGMYHISFDAFQKEQSEDQTSLWSFKVWKVDNEFDNSFAGLPVAWFAGRRKRFWDHHDLMFKAAEMFNAMIQGEIAGGGQSVVDYARTHHKLHRVAHEPMSASNKEVQGKQSENAFLMNMTTDRKQLGLTYLEDWHVHPRAVDEKGNMVLNVHMVYDIAFLREMRAHNPADKKQNTDRISDGIIEMFMIKENYTQRVARQKKSNTFFKRELYGSESAESQGTVSMY